MVFNELDAYDQNGGECAYRARDGHIEWCAGDSIFDSATLAGGVLFVEDAGSSLTAFNARTGAQLYVDDRHVDFGQPVVSNGTVYTGGMFRLLAYRP
jgi:outer membrane protein assembly factor BamB